MKKNSKKLALRPLTIKQLTADQLNQAAGGLQTAEVASTCTVKNGPLTRCVTL